MTTRCLHRASYAADPLNAIRCKYSNVRYFDEESCDVSHHFYTKMTLRLNTNTLEDWHPPLEIFGTQLLPTYLVHQYSRAWTRDVGDRNALQASHLYAGHVQQPPLKL